MLVPALSKIWVSGEYETKLSLQKILFSEGIVIDPNGSTYRTSNLKSIFLLIYSCTGVRMIPIKNGPVEIPIRLVS